MSSLIIEVCKVDKVEAHPNADRMSVVTVKGWQVCVGLNQFKPGDLCVYIPPDSVLPGSLSDALGVTKYLTPLPKNEAGVSPGNRVRVAKLRGFPSYGLIMKPEDPAWEVGKDVAEYFGITKWEPPVDCTDGDAERENPAFHRYFSLEHWRNFPNLLEIGEEIVITEKIHGQNARVGLIRDAKEDGSLIWRFMAGSHDVRRKELQVHRKRELIKNPDGTLGDEFFYEVTKRSKFWEIVDIPGIKEMLISLCNGENNVVLFGELFGSGVQDMAYGFSNGNWDFRAFDITLNGRYLSFDEKLDICNKHKVSMVPVLYRGPYTPEILQEYVSGPTTLCAAEKAGAFKGREGIVITATNERSIATENKMFNRAALKMVSFEYSNRKEGTEYH